MEHTVQNVDISRCVYLFQPQQFDDLPVGGISGAKKTFEELLEEELKKEEERVNIVAVLNFIINMLQFSHI